MSTFTSVSLCNVLLSLQHTEVIRQNTAELLLQKHHQYTASSMFSLKTCSKWTPCMMSAFVRNNIVLSCIHLVKKTKLKVSEWSRKQKNSKEIQLLDDSDLTFLGDQNVTFFFHELKTTVIRHIHLCSDLMWHINSSTVFKHNYEVFFYFTTVLIFSISWHFILLFHYILDANIVLFTPLHLSENSSY